MILIYKKKKIINKKKKIIKKNNKKINIKHKKIDNKNIIDRSIIYKSILYQKNNKNTEQIKNLINVEEILNKNNRINQIYISKSVKSFSQRIKNKYKLIDYYNIYQPTIFFGLYSHIDFKKIQQHKSLVIIIYGGTDALNILNSRNKKTYKKYIQYLKLKHVKSLSISKCISNDLYKLCIKSYYINFNLIDKNIFIPVKKGNSVYIYTSSKNPQFYGSRIYNFIIKELSHINFIVATKSSYNREELINIYSKCFIGLRLTKHDGNANTVQELGLCGIKCIHNGSMPNAIPWNNVENVIDNILDEQKTIEQIDYKLADRVKKILDTNGEPLWLYTNYYK